MVFRNHIPRFSTNADVALGISRPCMSRVATQCHSCPGWRARAAHHTGVQCYLGGVFSQAIIRLLVYPALLVLLPRTAPDSLRLEVIQKVLLSRLPPFTWGCPVRRAAFTLDIGAVGLSWSGSSFGASSLHQTLKPKSNLTS
jgi:hypothetical protein